MIVFEPLPSQATPANVENINANFNEVNLFKNHFNIYGNVTKFTTQMTIIDNSINLTFSEGNSAYIKYNSNIINNGKTYNISLESAGNTIRLLLIPKASINGSVLKNLNIPGFTYSSYYEAYYADYNSNVDLNITFDNSVNYFDIGFVCLTSPSQKYSNIQIEESSKKTSYVPFFGYLVESGTNDNGSWLKFSDGTMIQFGEKKIPSSATNEVVTLPESYINNKYSVIFSPFFVTYINVCLVIANMNESSFRVYGQRGNGADLNINQLFKWTTIGRWK